MLYLGNIITKNKIETSSFINITENINNINYNIPTLIIGWELVKKMFPEQNILESKITENITWTFSKREKRYKYEKDIEEFNKKIIQHLNNQINYRFFNYILSSKTKQNNFIEFINKGGCYIYYNSRFIYIYNVENKITIGISINDLFYNNIDTNQFIKKLNQNNNNLIFDNFNFINKNSFFLIKDNIKIIPYLIYLQNS
jgi:hypothetical protein